MIISEIKSKTLWEKFFNQEGSPSFLQAWEWGEFQKSLGDEIIRLGVYNQNQIIAIAQVIKIKAKRGNFLFLPHGPIISTKNSNIKLQKLIKAILEYLVKIAKKENLTFIRIAPILKNHPQNQQIFKNLGFKTAPIYLHSETVWQLALDSDEKTLLAKMRKTTRYLIKKAFRDNVIVEKRVDLKAIDDFYQIYEQTSQRERFQPFTKEYIKKEFEAFNQTKKALFLFARLNNPNQPYLVNPSQNPQSFPYLASALIIFTNSTAFYHQGASLHSKVPASYLLQWEAIREAKNRGCQFYNFWGIFDEESKRTPRSWKGLTLFKTGFGGEKIAYLPTQDYILKPSYYLTYLWEKFLFLKRNINF